ncbi:DNA-binding protein RFX5 isoform X2 [Hemicordylus capensis]|uniref:DNA-binding protein RFX5 isoform X2 n=1 Tax=Hemicordylus capensis TaxID=884348 RepID=UPI002303598D|nr:DNA-binding protein RFX5 isoform X2 [Hemicordylus capensis]
MADDNGLYIKIVENGSETLEADPQAATAEPSTLLQKLKGTISKSIQSKVDSILQDVQRFTDHAKLYLYLQLPSGPSSGEKNLDLTSLSSAEHMHACTWIRNHLEEYPDTCLPKQDVYDAYKRYCDNLCSRSLSAANFGKIIREIFPNIKARRLGGRGQSKYCYSGIRRKTVVNMPPLPSLDLKETEMPEQPDLVQSYNDDVMDAACALTCDWAEKILKRSFNNIVEVAQFLIQQHIISSRSTHADLVMATVVSETGDNHKEKRPPLNLKKHEPETQENAAKTQPPVKKENSPKPPAAPLRNEAKKPAEVPAKPASSPQVNALVARLPLLLPRVRVQPVERLVVSPGTAAVHSSPTVLAPSLTAAPMGGTVKMALSVAPASPSLPLNLAPAVNGPGSLVSPAGAVPVINMILPGVAVPPRAEIPPKRAPGDGSVNGCEARRSPYEPPPKSKSPSKRPAEPSSETATVKRKRGRPRKKPEEAELPPEKRAATQAPPGAKEDSDIIVVTVGYEGRPASPSSHKGLRGKGPDVEVIPAKDAKGAPPGDASQEGPCVASSCIVGNAAKAAVLPSQVSVIKGRRSAPLSLAKEAGSSSQEAGGGLWEAGSASQEATRMGQGVAAARSATHTIGARDSERAERHSPFDSDLQPTDLSLGKSSASSSRDPPGAVSLRGSSVSLHQVGTDQGKAVAATSPPVTSAQAPSR